MYKIAKTQYTIETIMSEVWHVQIWNEKNKYVWWINNCIIVLCVPCLMSSVHEMDCLEKETILVLRGRSVDQTVIVQRGSVLDVRGPEWFSSPFSHSGWVQFLESREGCTNDSLSSPD